MATKELRIGKLRRAATLVRAEADENSRTIALSFSSEEPVERWFGVEILGHRENEIDLEWLSGGTAPLLADHDPRSQIGVIAEAQLGSDRKGRAVVRFGKNARAEQEFRDALDGIRVNVSVAYEILEMELSKSEKGKPDEYRVTRWRPLEISLVSIPADLTVGVGRDAPDARAVIVSDPSTLDHERSSPMNVQTVPAAPSAPAPFDADKFRAEIAKGEGERIRGITYLGQRHQLTDLANQAIQDSTPLDAFRAVVLEALEKRGTSAPLENPASAIGLTPSDAKRYSLLRAIGAQATRDWSKAGFELECHQAIEKAVGPAKRGFYVPFEVQQRPVAAKRDLTVATASAGGYLVGTENQPAGFIEMLRARAQIVALGARLITGLQGNVTFPKQTAAGTAYWLSTEATAITESQQTLGQLAMTPKNVGAYTEVSKLLTIQSSPDAEALVMDDLAKVVALGIDQAAINGSGASGQPTGIINTAGIGAVTGTTIAYAGIVEFQTDVAAANALVNTAAYLTTPSVAGLLMQRQRFTSTDTPLWVGSVLDGVMAGFRATSTTQMPSANMLFGDFAQVLIGNWGVLELETNPFANFAAGIIGVRAWATVDIGIRQAGAFSLATGIT